jgi:hypothetical protein
MVVVISPTAPRNYEVVIERPDGKVVRQVPAEVAKDPLDAPQFDAIVREVKAQPLRRSGLDDRKGRI